MINLSLGGPEPSSLIRDAIAYAVGKGAFVAIAMGNAFEDGNPVDIPAADAADMDGVMSVGAVGPSLKRSFYSNTGPHLEISAPGGDDREGGAKGMIWQSTISAHRFDAARGDRAALRSVRRVGVRRHVDGLAARGGSGRAARQSGRIESGGDRENAQEDRAASRRAGWRRAKRRSTGHGLVQPRPALLGIGLVK